MKSLVVIGLGSNLGDREAKITKAVQHLTKWSVPSTLEVSPYIYTAAMLHPENPSPQPEYCNCVIAMQTQLSPEMLLLHTRHIEMLLGRTSSPKPWAARYIDIDILSYGTIRMASNRLTLPHPRITQRRFVLQPWLTLKAAKNAPIDLKASLTQLSN